MKFIFYRVQLGSVESYIVAHFYSKELYNFLSYIKYILIFLASSNNSENKC